MMGMDVSMLRFILRLLGPTVLSMIPFKGLRAAGSGMAPPLVKVMDIEEFALVVGNSCSTPIDFRICLLRERYPMGWR